MEGFVDGLCKGLNNLSSGAFSYQYSNTEIASKICFLVSDNDLSQIFCNSLNLDEIFS